MLKTLLQFNRHLKTLLLLSCAVLIPTVYAQGITANNDSTSKIVGSLGSFNIKTNDVVPATTVYSLQPSPPPLPQCVNAQVSAAGIASFTTPSSPFDQCTVVSAACPAGITPMGTGCQLSTLTVSSMSQIGQTMTTSTITIQPNADSLSVAAGQTTNVNTASNDTMPPGSGWFLMSSTCTPAPTMSSNGMLAVTGPSPAGSNCAAIYKACKGGANLPLPNADCGTATVFISSPTTQSTPTLTVTLAANTDTITVASGAQGNFNVLSNDVVPQGATVSLGSGSTCAGAGMSTTGMASYTAPAVAGASCTVVYQICIAPVTSPALVCRTASLIVTAQTSPTTATFSLKTDTASITAGQTGQMNVMRNDTYPSGSISSLGSGSTCPGASINNVGIASYTGPVAGSTCTVVYQVCTQATVAAASQCRTSTLLVTGLPVKPFTQPDSNASAAGSPTNYNVAANDDVPLGTQYFLGSSTCMMTNISAAGTVTYTTPANKGATCVVTYLACPANITPPSAFCSTQKLVVTAK